MIKYLISNQLWLWHNAGGTKDMRKGKDLGGEHLTMPEVNSDSSDSEQEGWLVVSEVLRTFVSNVRNFPDVIASSFSFRC